MIKQEDIDLVCELDSYEYKKSMKEVVSIEKQKEFRRLRDKLKELSDFFKDKYDPVAGPFGSERATGNPISFHGNLRRVWSGIFKGAVNKQYSAQVSFVINTKEKCLDVGFYFGRASSINIDEVTKQVYEEELHSLGRLLSREIREKKELRAIFDSLFDFGFKAEIKGEKVSSYEWLATIGLDPTHSSIVFNLKPNENGIIERSTIDLYVAMVLPLIGVLPETISKGPDTTSSTVRMALTPEQRAKQAEKRALIGLDGEIFILNQELNKFAASLSLPVHKSIISDDFGYDILSYENGLEVYIEVKTTTRIKGDYKSNVFYISAEEYDFYVNNKTNYRLYRVYDIYGEPNYEIIDMDNLTRTAKSYRVEFPQNL